MQANGQTGLCELDEIFYAKGRTSMPVRINITDDVVTAHLSGDIDHHTAKVMRQEIDDTIERVRPVTAVIDFGEVTFMDSSGIGLVLGRYKLTQDLSCGLKIVNMPSHLRKVMRVAGLDKLNIIE